jgi:hypothetical protein
MFHSQNYLWRYLKPISWRILSNEPNLTMLNFNLSHDLDAEPSNDSELNDFD